VDAGWTQVTPSDFPWEREALAFLKEGLPDHEPYRAWANFEFMLDGTIGEVDALVVVPKGVFLVEIKSWPGIDAGSAAAPIDRRRLDAVKFASCLPDAAIERMLAARDRDVEAVTTVLGEPVTSTSN
jgi:hypothetical protein